MRSLPWTLLFATGFSCLGVAAAGPEANLFKAGHRIRVDISSSSFPSFDINGNTGDPLSRQWRIANNTIHHGANTPPSSSCRFRRGAHDPFDSPLDPRTSRHVSAIHTHFAVSGGESGLEGHALAAGTLARHADRRAGAHAGRRFVVDRRANSLFGDGTLSTGKPSSGEAPDRYIYNPEDPVPTLGMDPNGEVEPLDHRTQDHRDEVLDIDPDGKAVNLWDGILRARYGYPAAIRAGVPSPGQFENPKLLKPGKTYKFFIEVGVVSNVFLKGHKIRVEVSSSNFPRFDRNLNNGGKLGVDTEIVIANQTVYHDAEHPSHILLPVIPER